MKRYLALTLLTVLTAAALIAAAGGRAVENEPPTANQPAAKAPASAKAAATPKAPAYKTLWIKDVPHVRQKPDFCGEACAAMYLQRLGQAVDQDYVFDQSGLDPLAARGCFTKELAAALSNIGFKTGSVWYQIPVAKKAEYTEAHWKAMHADLAAGVPSIVCMYYDDSEETTEHFRLILGYDAKTDEVLYHEPAAARGAYRRMKRSMLQKLWPLRHTAKQSNLIRLRLEPGTLKRGTPATTFTAADYAQHMMKLKKKLPPKGFTVVIQHPFVVIGDESAAMVKRRAVGTVKWSVDKLKQAYFTKDPRQIIDVWLFKDKASYRKYTEEIFGDDPDTPYGYFSHTDQALIMNIATGGGTLVHEIVHPFVDTNFSECPAWFNEGLGSLYEQSAESNGRIVGRTNWRLAGLQKAIKAKEVPSFKALCSTTTHEFYSKDPGTNYSQARYLCYYLQQCGRLRKFYHQFHANQRKDPSGYDTLQAVLGSKDMDKFHKDWEAYVLKLRF
ncbi:MAG: C39 family peptidase [Candidatus Nealsonbacteria bacterium]|nr:C39 family peptidase [Candidatus Nealsonbacteria bacterium]